MKHHGKNYACILLVIVLTSTAAHTKNDTCAGEILNSLAVSIGWSVGIPVAGWLCGVMISNHLHKQTKRIMLLNAATRVYEKKSAVAEAKTEDIERLNTFYKKLIRLYPDTELGRGEVIAVLHKYNKYGVKNGTCDVHAKLHIKLFPEDKVERFLRDHRNWQRQEAKIQKTHAAAAKVRSEKNESDDKKNKNDVIFYEGGEI